MRSGLTKRNTRFCCTLFRTNHYRSPTEWQRLCFQLCLSVCAHNKLNNLGLTVTLPQPPRPHALLLYRTPILDIFRLVQDVAHIVRKADSWHYTEVPPCCKIFLRIRILTVKFSISIGLKTSHDHSHDILRIIPYKKQHSYWSKTIISRFLQFFSFFEDQTNLFRKIQSMI